MGEFSARLLLPAISRAVETRTLANYLNQKKITGASARANTGTPGGGVDWTSEWEGAQDGWWLLAEWLGRKKR